MAAGPDRGALERSPGRGDLQLTSAPHTKPLAFRDLPEAVAALRERGLRLSAARRSVLETLFAAEGPVSAEWIARRLGAELTSVYRNLETLERHGILCHVHLGHGPGLYVLVGAGEREYLYCERCGAVGSVRPAELDPVRRQIARRFGYDARFTHFAIVGTCRACAQRSTAGVNAGPTILNRGAMDEHDHRHEHPHTHEHEHSDGTVHEHPHTDHEHDHVQHEHEHSHGDYVHSHPHVHQVGLEDEHDHSH